MARSTVSGTSRVTASELLAQYNERAHVGHREVEEEEVCDDADTLDKGLVGGVGGGLAALSSC